MGLQMFADAVKFSSTKQLEAVFNSVTIDVEISRYAISRCCEVSAEVFHRGRRYVFAKQFPVEYLHDKDQAFYEHYMRKRFPREIAFSVIEAVMEDAL